MLDEIKKATPMYMKHIRKADSLIADLVKALNVWIQEQIGYKIPVSSAIVLAKALDIVMMMIQRGESSKGRNFSG